MNRTFTHSSLVIFFLMLMQLARLSAQSVTVLYPNGGEVLPVNATVNITWNQTFLNNIRIEYSTNNGTSWSDIINSYPASTGQFAWSVPNTVTTQALIRLTDLVNTLIVDVSNQPFFIQNNSTSKFGGGAFDGHAADFNQANALVLASFINGGTIPGGSTQDIQWAALSSDFIDIEWSTDNGSSWNIVANSVQANLGLFSWQVPQVSGSLNLIRVKDAINPNQIFDISPITFSILGQDPAKYLGGSGDGVAFAINLANEILLIYPAGGERLPENTSINILWAANTANNVVLEYSSNNGSNWLSLGAPQPANLGSFSWQLPLGFNTQMRVRVADAANQSIYFDSSDAFTILNQDNSKYFGGAYDGAALNENQPAQINVLAPNGGETLYAGAVTPIQWTSINVDYVTLEYSSNNGSSWNLISSGVPSVLQSFNWTVPAVFALNTALIRISDDFNSSVRDTSNNTFTIPFQADVKFLGGGFDGAALAVNAANALTLIQPNGGEQWVEEVFQRIEWSANNFDNVRIEYSTNNGSNWILISASHPANIGFYNWQVPSTATLNARVRVLDALNQLNTNDFSDQVFAIHTLAQQKYFGGPFDGADMNVNQPPTITVTQPIGTDVWYEGQSVNIAWSNVNVNAVDIEISSDNGTTWTHIGLGQPAVLGQFTWVVSGFAAQNAVRVRVSDSSNPSTFGLSPAPHTIPLFSLQKNLGGSGDGHAFSVNPTNRIQVVSPNGGDVFAQNSLQQIQWAANDIGNVRIEYSTNNGSNWVLISSNQPGNVGLFNWQVPSLSTNHARVRVSDILNQSTIFDISDQTFVIAGEAAEKHFGGSFDGFSVGVNQPTSISVLTPNGGEVWYEGQDVNITWNSVNVTDVDIEISTNNGSSWNTIASNQPGVLGFYAWSVSGLYGSQSLVRIVDSTDPNMRDSSDASFQIPYYIASKNFGGAFDGHALGINANQALQVLAPNGGEIYAVGSTQQIFWNANNITNVRIEFSTNNGSSWTMISANEPGNTGIYQWVIPPVIGNQSRVRVLDVLNQFTVLDVSDNSFVIQDVNIDKYLGGPGDGHDMSDNTQFAVTVLSPNGGETWYEGQNVIITWSSVNINAVAIEISSNNGSTWNVLDPDEPAVVSSFAWQVSGNYGFNSNLIRIRSTDQPSVMDTSNAVFSIPQFVGNKHNGGSFDGFVSNINDANAIQLLSPNGGEVFADNSVQQILWNANNITNIRIEYSTNNGSNWILISANELANAGIYNWTVPAIGPANQVRVRVADVLNQFSRFDFSDANFSIQPLLVEKYHGGAGDGHDMNVNQPPSVTVIHPNGNEVWYQSQNVDITWSSVNLNFVDIEISSNSGSTWTLIGTNVPAVSGIFNWQVNGFYSANTNLIRISSATHVGVRDTSNAGFTIPLFVNAKHAGGSFDGVAADINDANSIQLIYPNGGQVFAEGAVEQILWNANNITNIRIEYSTNNGSVWTLISANELANSGVFNWTVPAIPSQQVLVRVADVLNQFTRFDFSDAVLQIQPVLADKYHGGSFDGHVVSVNQPPTVTVVSPNGGEVWFEGQQVNIAWNSVNLTTISIEISSNNGSSWSVIAPSELAVVGSFTWTVSGFYAQNSNLIRINSLQYPGVRDTSNATFSIPLYTQNKNFGGSFDGFVSAVNDANAIQLLYPIGGEVFAEGSVQQILWNANNITNIRIEYSSDNGSNWNLISANQLANTGAYNWTVPAIQTQQARIRIADVLNQFSRFDISDQVFQIQPVNLAKYHGGDFDGSTMNVNQPPTITVLSPNGGETWFEGQAMQITWNSVNVTSIAIDLSSNNGSSWTTIHSSEPAVVGNYSWTVNGFSANATALIRVRDVSDPLVKDSSNAGFTIPHFVQTKNQGGSFDGYAIDINANNAIQLLNPSGGEVFAEGSTQQILWNANNITNVRLDYSTNNGSSWVLISANEPANTGSFGWLVPSVVTQQGKIRIADVLNQSTVFALSNGFFSVFAPVANKHHGGSYDGHVMNVNQPPAVTVLSPNGNEVFFEGQNMPINWSQVNLTNVSIEISSNNGSSWTIIAPSVQAVIGNFNWTVSGFAGNSTVLVRIQDTQIPSAVDISDAGFSIPLYNTAKFVGGEFDGFASGVNQSNQLQILYPIGGETLADGSQQIIQWASNSIANVRLEYSANNGSNWTIIAASTPAHNGTYNWIVPSVSTLQALVRVADVQNPNVVVSQSASVFSIQGATPAKYAGGAFDGHAMNSTGGGLISVTSPNGGQTLYGGGTQNINWTSSNVGFVDIEYSLDNGSTWNLISSNISASLLSYAWTIPDAIGSTQALIKVTDTNDPIVSDVSDAVFTIQLMYSQKYNGGAFDGFSRESYPGGTVSLTNPNTALTLIPGSTVDITWTFTNLGDLALEYSTDNGSSWLSITPLTPAAPGFYAWLVPGTATTQGLVRASSANVPGIFDDSDQNFIIPFEFTQKYQGGAFDGFAFGVNQTPTLTLTSPIGGEVWAASSVQNITWSQTALASVKIDYSTDNGSTWNLVAANANATLGSFAWVVPSDYTVNALIRIEDAFNSVLSDVSPQVFAIPAEFTQKYNGGLGRGDVKDINAIANLVLTYPDVFENIPGSSQVQIAWMANTIANINIDYSINNGSTWINIISNTPANTGLFNWNVPNVNTTQGLVRISDAVNPSITFDISAQNFAITSPIADKYFGGDYDGHASAVNQPPSISVTYPNGGEILFSGDVVQITWTSINVQNVDLEFSSNSGSTWTTISTQQPASLGAYVWNIPVGTSGLGLVRITDSGNLLVRDTSNAVFTLPLEFASKFQGGAGDGYAADINSGNAIQLITPNGGESLADGSQFSIQWVANNLLNVTLEFSSNNGSNWQSIIVSTPANVGTFIWNVPSLNTVNARVRISDLINPSLYNDLSDQTFTINAPVADKFYGGPYDGHASAVNQPPSITVNYPNGGEVLYASDVATITWASVNVSMVRLDYSTNNGSSWNLITTQVPASLGNYLWTIPSGIFGNALIRIEDESNVLVQDVSNASFTIPFEQLNKFRGGQGDGYAQNVNAANALSLISPNGGESLADGGQFQIQWVSNNIGDVTLEYSVDNGSNWTAIIVSTPATLGSYTWIVPAVNTTQARIRVSDLVNPNQFNDASDQVFSITAPIADKHFGGSYDGSASAFNQPPSITVQYPNGGDTVYAGNVITINWTSSDVTSVDLEYSTNAGSTWILIIAQQPAPPGSFVWNVPSGITGPSLVRITDASNSLIRDTSNFTFLIPFEQSLKFRGGQGDGYAQDVNALNTIALITPNGGESLAEGENFSIQWVANNLSNITIEFSTNNGTNWSPIVVSTPANIGNYLWLVPGVNTNIARIRVSDLVNPLLYNDLSDQVFSITAPIADKFFGGSYDGHTSAFNQPPSIAVNYPNGGETIYSGDIIPITWTSSDVTNVDIEYSTNSGSNWIIAATQQPAALGAFAWSVPLGVNTQFALVRITDSGNTLIRDTSNSVFFIPIELASKYRGGSFDGYAMNVNANNTIALITPNGGESLAEGGQYNIEWVANGLIDVTLEYSTNNGSNWTPIIVSTPANAGNFLWTVPGINTNFARIRISDLVNPNAFNDVSDQVFTISAPVADKYLGGSYDGHASGQNLLSSITVTFPNGGETIYAGNVINVTWTSVDVTNVDLEYSTNNGSSWNNIAIQQPSSIGTFAWNVPLGISGNGIIRIKDSGDSLIRDISNATFLIPFEVVNKFRGGNGDGHAFDINNATALQLISPNGGEGIPDGTLFDIQWVANGINNLILEFSTNNGSAWQTVAISAPGNTGFYSWSVPGVNTTQARVRISDITNPGIFFDTSDQVFSIISPTQDKYLGGSYDGAAVNINQPPAITLNSPVGAEIFYPGNQHVISWTSLNVSSVNIDYSINNGSSWQSIATLQPASLGLYYWNVPQVHSNQALVRVFDSGNPLVADTSTAVFVIPQDLVNKYRGGSSDGYAMNINAANALQLISPNGGEALADGSQFSIQWIANNFQDVMLEYSSNNGSIWQAIVPVIAANSGSYIWSVPSTSTTLGRIRVSDLVDPFTYFDMSDTVFTIIGPVADKFFGGSYDGHALAENQPPAIVVNTPNGGETVYPEYLYEITWTTANIANVGIEYSSNNGQTWNLITSAYPAGAGLYVWPVPYLASDSVLVRVFDAQNPILMDSSNAVFNVPQMTANKFRGGSFDGHSQDINAANVITMVSPNGGENLPGGVNFTIEYAVNGIQNVSLDFSSNNGSTWSPVAISTPGNVGTFSWVTPMVSTLQAKMRVSDITNPSVIFDISDTIFTITSPVADKFFGGFYDGHAMNENQPASVIVISPNGNQSVYAGDVFPITWASVNLNAVDIEFSVDNGSSWNLIDTQVPATQGQYNWNVPMVFGNHVFVRIQEHANPLLADTSDAFFVIPLQSAVKFAGGVGSGHDMDINVNRILMVVAPNGGEVYASGSTQIIQWVGNTIQNVNVELSTNSGSSWSTLALNVPANLEAYTWQVGLNNTSNALVRVSDAIFTSTRRDTSDATFAILAPDTSKYFGGPFDGHAVNENQLASITLLTPNGGEIWNSQSTQLITWSQVNVANVDLEYSLDNGSTWILIQSQLPVGGGSFSWTVPNNGTPTALVRILDSSNSSVKDSSNAVFTIPNLVSAKYNGGGFDGAAVGANVPPVLTLTSPNGGEFWYSGSQQLIQWTASNLSVVSLDYSTDNGSTWNVITSAVPANSGSFIWMLPNVASNAALVRVTDAVGGILQDVGDAVFTIPHLTASKFNGGAYDGHGSGVNAANLIVLTEPNGGEIYPVMSPQNILWAANSIQAVNIEYSIDNGSNWFTLVTNTGGQFTQLGWSAPGPATTQALVRISQTGNPNVNVVSAAPFMTVDPIADKYRGGAFDGHSTNSNVQPLLTLLTPNGGERWFIGSRQNITWSQVNVSQVDLEVSNDNGSNWATIATQEPAQAGTYNWLVTGPGSSLSLVRIKSSSDSLVRDSSNLVFEIPFQQDGKYAGGGFDGHAMSQNVPPAITVLSPNGGETIYPLNTVAITWSSTNVSNVGIEYSTDFGSNWISIIAAVSAQSGSYPWLVPTAGTQSALVRVFDVSSPSTVNDISNAVFTIPLLANQKFNGGSFDGSALGFNLTTATIAGSDTLCPGDSILLSFALTGSAPWNITFTDGTTPISISGITASPYQAQIPVMGTRTYTIQSVTSSSGSGIGIGAASAFVYALPGVGFPPDPTICLGQSVPITVGLTGTAPWSLTWTDGTTSSLVTGLTSQPYTIIVTPSVTTSYLVTGVADLNCSNPNSFTTQVNVLALPDATIAGADTVCPGTNVPLTVQFMGTSPYSFTYNDGTASQSISGITGSAYTFNVSPLASTTYLLTSVSDNTCSAVPSSSVSVAVEQVPTATVSGSNTICIGSGTPIQFVLSGTAPWDLTWTDGSSNTQVTGISASPYTMNVSPVSNITYSIASVQNQFCSGTSSGSAQIDVLHLPTAVLTGSQTVCQTSQASLTTTLTGVSPWTITWSDGTSSNVVSGITSQPYLLQVSPVAQTTYIITNISDAGCQQSVNTQVIVGTFGLPSASISSNQTICTGLSAVHTVSLTGVSPWSFTWTDGNTQSTVTGVSTQPYVFAVTPTQNTTYLLVNVADAHCAGSVSGTSVISLDAVPTAAISGTNSICIGNSSPLQIALTGSSPWNLTWTDGTTSTQVTGITSSPYTFSVSPVSNQTFSLVSIQNQYCGGTVSGSAEIDVLSLPTAILTGNQTVCQNTQALLTTALTGIAPWTITWTDGTSSNVVSGISSQNYVISVTPAIQTSYAVTQVADAGCQQSVSTQVVVNTFSLPSATLSGNQTICNGLPAIHTIQFTGAAPWDVTWTDGITPTSVSGITTSPYFLSVTPAQNTSYQLVSVLDANCVGSVSGASAIFLDPVPTASIGANQTICLGCSTTVQLQLSGTGPWDIVWTDGTTPVSVTGISVSPYVFNTTPSVDVTYSLVSVQGNYCAGTVSGSAAITVIAFPTASISGSQTVCEGTTASLSIALTGLSPWIVTWSDGVSPVSVSGITVSPYIFNVSPTQNTTYRVTYVEDAFMTSGPVSDSANVRIDSLPLTPQILSALNISCSQATLQWNTSSYSNSYRFDLASDSLFANIISGYQQFNTGTDTFISISGLNENARYFWRVRGVNPCGNGQYSLTGQFNTSDLASLILASSNAPICNGTTLQLSGTSSYPGTVFSWSGPAGYSINSGIGSRTNMTPLQAGAYTLYAIASGCNQVQQVLQVAVNDSISNLISGGNTALCAGESLVLTATATGTGIVFQWAGPGGFTATGNPSILSSISNSNAGIFTLTAISPGCNQEIDTVHVQVTPSVPVVVSNSGPHCTGDPVYFSASFVPSVPYLWTGPNGFSSTRQNPSISNITLANAGLYSLQVTQSGCSTQVFTTQVQIGSRTNLLHVGGNTPLCTGQSLVMTATVYPDAQYQWTGPNGFTGTGNTVTIPNTTLAMSGQYSVVASTVGCVSTTRLLNVLVYSTLSASATINSPICEGQPLYLEGSNHAGATYLWQGPNGFTSNLRQPSISLASTVNAGVYTLSVNQPVCGASSVTVTTVIGGRVLVSPLGNNSPVCLGNTLNISAPSVQNGTVLWQGPGGFSSSSPSFSIPNTQLAQAGEYTVTSSSPGCGTLSSTTTVHVNQSPVLTIANNTPVCEGNVVVLSVTSVPGVTYQWSGPNGFQATGNNASVIQSTPGNSGIYTLVASQPGCGTSSITASVFVGSNIVGIAPSSNSPVCLNGSLQLSAEARTNVDYLWQGPDGFTSNLSSLTRAGITALQAGLYSLSINSNGCGQAISSIQVIMNNPAQVTASNNTPICGGSNFTLSGTGNRNSSYLWVGPNAFSAVGAIASINNAAPSATGIYTLQVTDPGCGVISATTSVVVGVNLNGTNAENNSPVCVGSSVQLSATFLSGATYSWTGPNGFTSTIHNPVIPNASFANAGHYQVLISSVGCPSISRSTTVFVNPPVTSVSGNNSPVCQGGVVYLTGNFIPNATYTWAGPAGFTSNQRNPSLINAQPISSGTYTLTVSTPGCNPAVSTTVVTVGSSLIGVTIASNTPVCVGNNLLLSTTIQSGYTYSWTGPNGFTSTVSNPQISGVNTNAAGSYVVQISSAGCGTVTRSHSVAVQNVPGIQPGSNSPVCQGGVIYLTANSVSGVTYNWSGPNGYQSNVQSPGISNAQVVHAGEYTLTINQQACGTQTLTTLVGVGSSLSGVNILSNNPLCVGQNLTLSATDRPGFTFLWSGPNGFTSTVAHPIITNVTTANTGSYAVQFTSLGCGIANRTVSIRVNDPSLVTASNTGPACVNAAVYFTGTAPAGSTYSWSGPAGYLATVQSPSRSRVQLSHAGEYTLTANVPGCGGVTSTTTVVVNVCREQDLVDVKDLTTDAEAGSEDMVLDGKSIDDISVPDSYILTAWPNPTGGDMVHLRWEGLTQADKDITVKVYDASGKTVFIKSVARKNLLDVNIDDTLEFPVRLAQGIYTVETVHDGRWQYVRLIVQ